MKTSGVYKIYTDISDSIYIGSAIDLKTRKRKHLSDLNRNKHHAQKLQNFVNKHGIDSLKFETIEFCSTSDLISREQYYLDTLNPFFNTLKTAYSHLGAKRSKDTRDKISKAITGKKLILSPTQKARRIEIAKSIDFTFLQRPIFINSILYESITIAAEKTGIHRTTIAKHLNGKRKYKSSKLDIKYHDGGATKKRIMSKESIELGRMNLKLASEKASKSIYIDGTFYKSISEAVRVTKISSGTIWSQLKNPNPSFITNPRRYNIKLAS